MRHNITMQLSIPRKQSFVWIVLKMGIFSKYVSCEPITVKGIKKNNNFKLCDIKPEWSNYLSFLSYIYI